MFADEYRADEELRQQHKEYLLSDPETLVAKYEELVEQNLELLATPQQSQSRIDSKKKSAWDAERKDLLRKLGEAHGALKIYREGYWNLRDEISDLRRSRSMRIGRAITSPYQKFKSLGTRQEPAEDKLVSESNETAPPSRDNNATALGVSERPDPPKQLASVQHQPQAIEAVGVPAEHAIEVDSPLPIGERTFDRLKFEFDQNPTSLRLKRVLTRAWYTHGLILEPAGFIQDYPHLVDDFSAKDKQLVEQILAAERVRDRSFELPPRARGAAYLVEPDRVMYCVHSTPVFNSNGYSTRTRGVAQGLHSVLGDVFVVGRPGYPWDTKADKAHPEKRRYQELLDGIPYVHVPGASLNNSPMDFYIHAAADAYVREARRLRPELIHAASNHLTALPALIAARRLGVPFVYEVRGFWEFTGVSTQPEWENSERFKLAVALETLVATEADHIVAITQQVADELVERGVAQERISLAENAVDPQAILPLPQDVKYGAKRKIRTDVPVIGFAGSVVPYEGLETLLEASALLADREVDHQIVIAGSGSSVDKLKKMRDTAKLKTVTFLGRIPNTEIPRLFSTFDIMPCPRLSQKVTELVSPLKPLEAFSASKAVVLSDVAPHVDLAGAEQERALLFKAGDAEDLANVLQRLIQDNNLLKELGRAGRLWTLSERNWTALGEKLSAVYHQTIVEHSEAQPIASRPLASVKLGVIADEFTTSTLAGACEIVAIDRMEWRDQLEEHTFDAIFVESAWAGNNGQWHRGVGYYGPEESQDLFDLLTYARNHNIPSIFWNKEDPVHIERFLKTASQCDYIFTTDANMIPRYLQEASTATKTVASLPFYAEPTIHNPLPSNRPYEHTVAYAGTYYGDRYKQRSDQLRQLLEVSEPYGITIYDRQLQYENSPYQFPPEFQNYVEGSLPYSEVLHQYKSHLAQLNVNSVMDSPTMYSRRVIEIAASGGIVLSGPGRGIEEALGDTIFTSHNKALWNAALYDWANNPESRLNELWRQMRTVLRSHTTTTALSLVLRTAGVPVDGLIPETYAVRVTDQSEAVAQSLLNQSLRPSAVIVDDSSDPVWSRLVEKGVQIVTSDEELDCHVNWFGELQTPVARTHFEDLLSATFYGSWNAIWHKKSNYDFGTDVARPLQARPSPKDAQLGLQRTGTHAQPVGDGDVLLQLAAGLGTSTPAQLLEDRSETARRSVEPKVVLFAGHDLKFARKFMEHLEAQGHRILVDEWEDHNKHDEAISRALLSQADTVFCEWGLGNAVWYSKHISKEQRLVVRVHSQELRRDYLAKILHGNVDEYIFVGELVRSAAAESHGVPAEKTQVIPNAVDIERLALPKTHAAKFNLGLVGIVPRTKRLDLALDVIEEVRLQDDRYRLFIKGKQPHDYPWLMNIETEMKYYDEQYQRIQELNAQSPGVVTFDEFGSDMEEWYRKIGSVLSVSDFESFHLTLADGVASGASPYSLLWPGADLIYSQEWLYISTHSMARAIVASRDVNPQGTSLIDYFAQTKVFERLSQVTLGMSHDFGRK